MVNTRIERFFRESSVPYLTAILLGSFSSALLAYMVPLMWPDRPVLFGQSPAVIAPFLTFPVVVVLWFLYDRSAPRNRNLNLILSAFAVLWIFHVVVDRFHGSQTPYFFLLTLPLLGLIWLKPPAIGDVRGIFLSLGIIIALFLTITRLLEIFQILPMYYVPENIVRFDTENYWLPFSGQLGLEGRWTGPTGSTTRTSVVASILILIGIKYKSALRAPFIVIGILAILLAGSRTGYLTLFIGLFTLFFLGSGPIVRRAPFWSRTILLLALGTVSGIALMLLGPGTTGRSGAGGIWSGFIDAWRSNPLLGVGKDKIPNSESSTSFSFYTEAHNMFIGQGASYGWIGVTVVILTLSLLIFVGLQAAMVGNALPIAIFLVYSAASLTDVYNDWISANYIYVVLVFVGVVAAKLSPASRWKVDVNERDNISKLT